MGNDVMTASAPCASWRLHLYNYAPAMIATVLIAAACAKTYQLTSELTSWNAMTSGELLTAGLIVVELTLAGFLLARRGDKWTRSLAVVCFLAFACYSLHLVLVGAESCGCFGRVSISPWLTLAFDGVAAAVLATTKLDHGAPQSGYPSYLIGAGVMAVSLCIFGWLYFGSIPAALSFVSGARVFVTPNVMRVGVGAPGEYRQLDVTIFNHASKTVHLIGTKHKCEFYLADKPSVTLLPGESRNLTLFVLFSGTEHGPFRRSMLLYTTDASSPAIYLEVAGIVRQ